MIGRRFLLAALAGFVAVSDSPPLMAEANPPRPRVEMPLSTMQATLNFGSKIICSEHFITGRSVASIAKETLAGIGRAGRYRTLESEFYPYTVEKFDLALQSVQIDPVNKIVTLASGPYAASAKHYGDQGCVMLAPGQTDAYFDERPVPRKGKHDGLFPADGDLVTRGAPLPAGYRADLLEQAAAEALKPTSMGAAFLVLHKGDLVLERYAQGIDAETATLNWSMGKSILGTLIGRLEHMGKLSLDDPAPIELWSSHPKDPRSDIKIIDLLTMQSGLFCGSAKRPWAERDVVSAHEMIYNAPVNVVQHAIRSPSLYPPGQKWAYSNCDMQALGYILKNKVSEEAYHAWPYTELYNKIGMTGMVSEVDTFGNFHLTGFDYGTARDWARYGLLYLNGGVWEGERLLSEAFVEAVMTPGSSWYDETGSLIEAPATYGGAHWLNTGGKFVVPRDAIMASGFSGNHAIIVPSADLVIVMLRITSIQAERADLNEALRPLMAGLGITVE